MGEAKRKREALKKAIIASLTEWSFPESEWEEQVVSEIRSLKTVTVLRYPDEALQYMRMPPQKCHANARFMQDNDPEGRVKQVTGWKVEDNNYVLHSVILQGEGEYACVTPTLLPMPPQFDFIPDEKIEWREEGDYRVAYRNGGKISKGVRGESKKTLEQISEIRKLIESGVDPMDAIRVI